MVLTRSRIAGIESWTGRLLGLAGAALLLELVSGSYGSMLGDIPFAWLLGSLPFGIGFVLAPLVLLRSSQYLADRTPRAAVVGSSLVAALPVGAVVLVAWGLSARATDLVPDLNALPVSVSVVFFGLLACFAVGSATFGLAFLREERTRWLGGSLLLFAAGWAFPLAVAKLSGVYPGWLSDLLVVSVATSMIAIGYCFPPLERQSEW